MLGKIKIRIPKKGNGNGSGKEDSHSRNLGGNGNDNSPTRSPATETLISPGDFTGILPPARKDRDPLTGRMERRVPVLAEPEQRRELSLSATLGARLRLAARKVNRGCLEFDPLEELTMMAMGEMDLTNGQRINCLHIIASFLYPKQKSIEYRDTDFESIRVDVTVFDPASQTVREDIQNASSRWSEEDFGDNED